MVIGVYIIVVLIIFEKLVFFYFIVLIGGLFVMICGFIIGFFVLWLRGDYFVIVIFGFGEIIRVII